MTHATTRTTLWLFASTVLAVAFAATTAGQPVGDVYLSSAADSPLSTLNVSAGAITKGNLTVTIAETPEASQPGPLSEGETEVLSRTSLLLEEEDSALTIVNGAVTLNEVVEVLNVLGVTPRDMIQILQSMGQSGMLHADIVVM